MDDGWQVLADAQQGMLARRQLRAIGINSNDVRNQIAAGRWAARSCTVISTFTGGLSATQRLWLGVLHAGERALVGGLSAANWHGLQHWERDKVTIIVPWRAKIDPLPGVDFVRSRRALESMRDRAGNLPVFRIEPAVLLYAAYTQSERTASGVLAATVQQRLTSPERLLGQIQSMQPLRRAARFRALLRELAGGAQSLAEVDIRRVCDRCGLPRPRRQVRRKDSSGRLRFTDCEWILADGRTVVLEIDGSFHMEVEHWEDDIARHRGLTSPTRLVVRCTARELRDDPMPVVRDLRRLGVGAPSPLPPGRGSGGAL